MYYVIQRGHTVSYISHFLSLFLVKMPTDYPFLIILWTHQHPALLRDLPVSYHASSLRCFVFLLNFFF